MLWPVIENLLSHVSLLEFRRCYPVAQLTAFVGNAMGGKGDGKGKKAEPSKMFSPLEFVPWYARPEGFQTQGGHNIPRHVAKAFLEASKRALLPAWVVAVAPVAAIRNAAA
jgi:hypothetical protein